MSLDLSLAGFLIGLLVGMTGMGGGSLMTPMLVLVFGFKPTVAIGTDILHGAIFKSFGAVRHRQLGHVHARLTFWMLLLLNEHEMYAYEMRPAIVDISQQTIDVDDNSVYRALKRFADAGFVKSEVRASETGPARRYFILTPAGRALLAAFIERNLLVFQSPPVIERIRRVIEMTKGDETDVDG